jgi:hypothetical protein
MHNLMLLASEAIERGLANIEFNGKQYSVTSKNPDLFNFGESFDVIRIINRQVRSNEIGRVDGLVFEPGGEGFSHSFPITNRAN